MSTIPGWARLNRAAILFINTRNGKTHNTHALPQQTTTPHGIITQHGGAILASTRHTHSSPGKAAWSGSRFGSTVLVIKTDMTHTVTHQTTHILPPTGTQNALGESHKKASTQQATRRTGVLARCRRAHCARFERWRSQKHRWWPSAGVSGGGRGLTLRADDSTSPRNNPTPTNPTQTTPLKARFSCWALSLFTALFRASPGGPAWGWGETTRGPRRPALHSCLPCSFRCS